MDKNTQQIIDRARAVCASWEQVKASTGFDDKEKALEFLDAGLERLIVAVDEYDKPAAEPDKKLYNIYTTYGDGYTKLYGVHRPDLESNNWHYYDSDCGARVHFRKEHMIMVWEYPDDQDT